MPIGDNFQTYTNDLSHYEPSCRFSQSAVIQFNANNSMLLPGRLNWEAIPRPPSVIRDRQAMNPEFRIPSSLSSLSHGTKSLVHNLCHRCWNRTLNDAFHDQTFKSSWDSQDFGDVSMVWQMAHFRKSTRPQWINCLTTLNTPLALHVLRNIFRVPSATAMCALRTYA